MNSLKPSQYFICWSSENEEYYMDTFVRDSINDIIVETHDNEDDADAALRLRHDYFGNWQLN